MKNFIKSRLSGFFIFTFVMCQAGSPAPVFSAVSGSSPDRAVEIARRARDRVERSGESLKVSMDNVFQAFAERTLSLQKLIDARKNLEASGLLDKNDPDGAARRAHINGKILCEIGELKETCDRNLTRMLQSLETFDMAVADSLVDSQSTRSINSNYELAIKQYLKQGQSQFEQAAKDAEETLNAYQGADDLQVKKRLLYKYSRTKQRLLQINQRRSLYEARLKAAAMNQKVAAAIRAKIRKEGHEVPTKFRSLLANLYSAFFTITPLAEMGGTGSLTQLGDLGFANISDVKNTLDIVDGSIDKLGGVLNDMVNDVLSDLGDIQVIETGETAVGVLSVDEEIEFLRNQRENWAG